MSKLAASLGPCCICNRAAAALCSRCHKAAYCGEDCQRTDWRTHKQFCKASSSEATHSQDTSTATCIDDGDAAAGRKQEGHKSTSSSSSSLSGIPGTPAEIDVVLVGHRSIDIAQKVIDRLKERGVCVIKAGADRSFQRAVFMESRQLWLNGHYSEAKKGMPVTPGSSQIRYDNRDDKVVFLTNSWFDEHEKEAKALKVLDAQLADFGWGLKQMLEDQLGLTLSKRTPGMLSCYDGTAIPGAKYDFHIDNPYQTQMDVPDDGRRLTVIYYISDGAWDVQKDGGALQVCLSNPRRAPRTATEAKQSPTSTIAPEPDTLVVFFSHTMYHAVLPVMGRQRFAVSSWFMQA